MRSSLSLTLVAALFGAAVVAACGESTPAPPQTPTAAPPATSAAPPAPTPSHSATAVPETTPPPTASATAPKPPEAPPMPQIMASKMADDLKAAGLDINKLPSLKKMKGDQKGKVMPLISKATGFECKACHVEENGKLNAKKVTPLMQIADHMWDEYVVPGKLADGGAIFCDSCHQGKHDFLTGPDGKRNKDAVSAFMDANYVKKMARKDGKEQNCQTCHTADFEMKIFEKVWKVKR